MAKEEYEGWIIRMPSDKNALQVKTMKICEKQVIQFDFNDILPLGVKPIQAFGHTPGQQYIKNMIYLLLKI